MNRHSWKIVSAVALLAMTLGSATSRADTVIAELVSMEPDQSILIWLGGSQSPAVAGQYNWVRSGGTAVLPPTSFSTYCIELTQHIGPGVQYTFEVLELQDAPVPGVGMGVAKAEQIHKLWSGYIGATAAGNTEKMAFQAAIWEIVYNDGTTPLDVTIGNFRVDDTGAAYATLANQWLDSLSTLTGPFPVLKALSSTSHQDQVFFFADDPGIPPIPLPAAVWAGLVLMGLIGVRRRLAARVN